MDAQLLAQHSHCEEKVDHSDKTNMQKRKKGKAKKKKPVEVDT